MDGPRDDALQPPTSAAADPADFWNIVSADEDGLIVVDREGDIRFLNPAARRMFGRTDEELVGAQIGFPIVTGQRTEIELLRPDGTPRVVELRVSALRWQGQPMLLAAMRDITSLRAKIEELEEVVEERSAVVATASHEIRNPLTVISGLAATLVDRWADLDDARRFAYVERVSANARRLEAMVGNLLTISRLQAGALTPRPEPFEMSGLLLDILERFPEHLPDIAVECPRGVTVMADPNHTYQIIVNLLSNAIKYGSPPIQLTASSSAVGVDIVVMDQGAGVPEGFRDRLFERFTRAAQHEDEGTPGSGIGLSIVAGLAAVNGGTAGFEPNEPTGARFRVTLPSAPS